MIDEILNKISKRQLAMIAGVDQRTLCKYLSNQKILYVKEQKIKLAIANVLGEEKKVNEIISKAK